MNRTVDAAEEEEESWLEVLDDLLDEEIDRDEALELTAEDLEVDVPLRFGEDSPHAKWGFDGTVRVSVEGPSGPLADWLRFWYERSDSSPSDLADAESEANSERREG
ncbi:hypothetical protein [Haloparvum sp. PAK95]|uniref:hypothetical protein n=1 Tax=Haloparvum sp. PAK95 TaxID=3418962 RepID=UPI003D2ECD15